MLYKGIITYMDMGTQVEKHVWSVFGSEVRLTLHTSIRSTMWRLYSANFTYQLGELVEEELDAYRG